MIQALGIQDGPVSPRTIMSHDTTDSKLTADWLCLFIDQLASFKRDQATRGPNRADWQGGGGSLTSPRGHPASAGPRGRPSGGSPAWSSHWHRSRPMPPHPRPAQRELESDLARFVQLCFRFTPGSVVIYNSRSHSYLRRHFVCLQIWICALEPSIQSVFTNVVA